MKRKEKDKKELKILKILIFVMAIVFAILIFLMIYYSPAMSRRRYGYETMSPYGSEEFREKEEKTIRYRGIENLQYLKGDFPVSQTTEQITKIFLEGIPEILEEVKNLTPEELNTYYTSNVNKIYNILRISKQESFVNMVNEFKNITCNLKTEFDVCEITSSENETNIKFSYVNGQYVDFILSGTTTRNISFEF